MNKTVITLILASLVLLTGCNTTWTTSQRSELTNVGVADISVGKDAYHKPDATQSPGMHTTITTATGGGLIPSLIGSAIDAKVMAKQRKIFESTALAHFPTVEDLAGNLPTETLKERMTHALSKHDFFSSRLSQEPTEIIKFEIIEHGYIRAFGATEENMMLAYEIAARVTLTDKKGSKLLNVLLDGISRESAKIEEIAASPELVEKQVSESIENLILNILLELDRKLQSR